MSPTRAFLTACCAALTVQLLPGVASADTPERLSAAADTMRSLGQAPDRDIPQDLLEKARCVVVVPAMKKGAFVVGAKYGRGFASCRDGASWTAPAGVRVEGGSVGFQIGGSETDVVMLVMNDKGMDRLLSTKFTLGGDASVAAGPVGRSATAKTDAALTAEILSYSRTHGVFAGVALEGATLRQDDEANRDLYGKERTNRQILTGEVSAPHSAQPFLNTLRQFSSTAEARSK